MATYKMTIKESFIPTLVELAQPRRTTDMDSIKELNEVLTQWALKYKRTGDIAAAVRAVNVTLIPTATKRPVLSRRDGRFIVSDDRATYVAQSFREAKAVLRRCHDEQIDVDGYIALYCEV